MRIGIFTDSYKPYISGVVRSIELFTSEFEQMGHEVIIFSPNYPGVEKEKNVYRFPSVPSLAHDDFYLALPFSWGLKNFIKEKPLDIVHVHSPFILGRLGARLAKRMGIPLVFTYHTLYDQYTHYVPLGKDFSKQITRKMCVNFCNRCHLVITPTEIISHHIKNMGVTSPVNWLPTGIDLSEFSNSDRHWLKNTYKINPHDIVMLFVGRAGKEKNIPFIIKSFSLVHKQHPHTKLFLVGEGPELDNLKNLVKSLQLEDSVIWTGKLQREELIKAYCGADLFVFGSLTETQGLVIAEAKAAGLPVIAVDAFGVSNMVSHEEDGFLVQPDIQMFYQKITQLINNPDLRRKMSTNALRNVQKISSHQCAKKLENYYNELKIKAMVEKQRKEALL
ncbi:1,2-diacylglycerol 3-glucosyltransferase [Desulforamulus reducens MI-1]|uniref:1,2-diacylglycerol 3-glucosyltransferase n=1 Tax=Desulforamulus reducens (strain ATCC BAA-1160 / DSM 100696 / MI-1) TaxID=349161 RepID=A4J5H2_DESRM|nr:glycosyltransferase family 4 protein [Desulforamulus reducens]ABO50325.1 1,2-diacylglycerol 3-glucosyltransferase [Desulforamulus reducens MI-1]